MKIVISSGHGKYIRGAAGDPVPPYLDEVDEARKVVEQVAIDLRGIGVETTTYHDDISTSQNENLNRIVDFHNSKTRDLDVSVHFNAYEQTSKPMGCEVLYVSQTGFTIAADVADRICIASGLIDRGAKKRTDLFFLNNTEEPAVLIETAFCDSLADADIYRAKFADICAAIAGGLADEDVAPGPIPPEPEPIPPDPSPIVPRRTLQKGDEGDDVAELQAVLGLIDDGNFGEVTETQVEAFQAACDNLDIDGVVGPATWEEVAALDARLITGSEGLASDLAVTIVAVADNSSLAEFQWPDRGQSPPGYLAGMALSFAVAFQMLLNRDPSAVVMSRLLESDDTDALAWYESELTEIGVELGTPAGRLRGLFVLLIGLGMRESSGRYCEGRDMSADNVEADTCEAGLFQTSWNISNASELFDDLIEEYWQDPTGYLGIFREGISPTANNLDVYGTGDGARYQFLAKFCPLYACLTSALGLRLLRQHWGPINRHEVDVEGAAEDLLYEVQLLVEAGAGV